VNIHKATHKFEAWLGGQGPLIARDLRLKHKLMRQGVVPFLRGTFYRWCQLWPEICPDLAKGPKVLGVGDLHVENFGTWRDGEGRLVWGINDFDEVAVMPYTLDLVRLAASARMAIAANHLRVDVKDACDAILSGYGDALKAGGCPIVLGEQHPWLRELAISESRDPLRFWDKMGRLPRVRRRVPRSAMKAIVSLMPDADVKYRVAQRTAGIGSLGRERYTAIADWRGGKIAREAKALVTSAYAWARGGKIKRAILYQEALDQAVRCCDPFVRVHGRWIVRRLAPDCSRIELSSLPKEWDEARLFYEMGWETGNVHCGNPKAVTMIARDLRKRPAKWLHDGARAMTKATVKDWREWKTAGRD
jgi:uncharacterized protein (DUF2252 family)